MRLVSNGKMALDFANKLGLTEEAAKYLHKKGKVSLAQHSSIRQN